MTTRHRNLTAHLLLLAVVLVWGTTFPLVKSALTQVSPLLFNTLRMALAFAALAAVNASTLRNLTRREVRLSALTGLFLALGYEFQTTGLTRTTPSKSAFLTGLVVVIVPLLCAVPAIRGVGHARPRLPAYLGALTALTGLVLLTTTSGAALLSGLGVGEALTLLCAVAFAAHLLTVGHAAKSITARRLGTLQIGFAALVMLLALPLEPHPHFHATPVVWAALLITGLLATAAAFTIQSWAQQHLPASHLALIFTLEPVFAWLTSLIFLQERLGFRALSGAALILAGILVAELWPVTTPEPIPV